jgi:hypothetical protein
VLKPAKIWAHSFRMLGDASGNLDWPRKGPNPKRLERVLVTVTPTPSTSPPRVSKGRLNRWSSRPCFGLWSSILRLGASLLCGHGRIAL